MYNILYHTCIYSCLPEDEPSGSEYLEDIINSNISLEKVRLLVYVV